MAYILTAQSESEARFQLELITEFSTDILSIKEEHVGLTMTHISTVSEHDKLRCVTLAQCIASAPRADTDSKSGHSITSAKEAAASRFLDNHTTSIATHRRKPANVIVRESDIGMMKTVDRINEAFSTSMALERIEGHLKVLKKERIYRKSLIALTRVLDQVGGVLLDIFSRPSGV